MILTFLKKLLDKWFRYYPVYSVSYSSLIKQQTGAAPRPARITVFNKFLIVQYVDRKIFRWVPVYVEEAFIHKNLIRKSKLFEITYGKELSGLAIDYLIIPRKSDGHGLHIQNYSQLYDNTIIAYILDAFLLYVRKVIS